MFTLSGREEYAGANLVEKVKVLALWNLGLGSWPADLVIQAEIAERSSGRQLDSSVSPKKLGKFFMEVAHTSQPDRYGLLARPVEDESSDTSVSNQQVWFDVITGLTEPPIVRGIVQAARDILPAHKALWKDAADFGAGTGKLGAALSGQDGGTQVAENVTLVDNNSSLLNVAASRYGETLAYQRGDVTHLPFADQSFDLIASSGLVYNLGRPLQGSYFLEVSRLLSPGGIHLDADYVDDWESGLEDNFGRYSLNRFIKTAIFPAEFRDGNPLRGVDQISFFGRVGLQPSHYQYTDEASGAQVNVRALEKVS